MIRWKLHDEDAPAVGSLPDWVFPINPNKMDSPELLEEVSAEPVSFDGTNRDTVQPSTPGEWSFQGVLYTLEDVDMLVLWLDHGRAIHLTDHYDRTWRIQLQDIGLQRAGTRLRPHRHTYSVSALMLGRVIA